MILKKEKMVAAVGVSVLVGVLATVFTGINTFAFMNESNNDEVTNVTEEDGIWEASKSWGGWEVWAGSIEELRAGAIKESTASAPEELQVPPHMLTAEEATIMAVDSIFNEFGATAEGFRITTFYQQENFHNVDIWEVDSNSGLWEVSLITEGAMENLEHGLDYEWFGVYIDAITGEVISLESVDAKTGEILRVNPTNY